MRRSKIGFWLFLLPCLLAFVTIVIIPMFMGLYYAFTDWNGVGLSANFIGLTNFVRVLTQDTQFGRAFIYTASFAFCAVILVNLVGFSLAMLVTKKFRGSNLLRGVFFMPNLIGGLLLGFAWQFIFTKVFTATGIPFLQGWLTNSTTGFIGLLIILVWQMGGYVMLIYIAALQNIPDSIIEASQIDGATSRTRLLKITVPMVAPAFTIGLFLTLSNSFKLFDQNLSLTNGGPNNTTQMLALNIYQTAFSMNRFGESQAKALIFLIAVALITTLQLYYSKKSEVEM